MSDESKSIDQLSTEHEKSKSFLEAKRKVMEKVGYVKKGGKVSGYGANYSFAGEADFIAALRPEMIKQKLVIAPVDMELLQHQEFKNKNGTIFNNVVIKVTYELSHSESGGCQRVVALGEGSDTGDKAVNKAMTGAYKYALRQSFLVETGDDPDKVSSGEYERRHQPEKQPQQQQPPKQQKPPQQNGNGKKQPTVADVMREIEKAETQERLVTFHGRYHQLGFNAEAIKQLDAKLKQQFEQVPGNVPCPVQ